MVALETPFEGFWLLVAFPEKLLRAIQEMLFPGVTGVTQHAPGVDAEQQFDLVDPGGMEGGEMELETAAVPLVEIHPNTGSVRIQVVPDHMDDLLRPSQGDLVHERQEVGLSARLAATGDAAPCMNVQGCKESLGAVANVFKFDPSGSPPTRRSIPLLAFGDLNPRLFVDGQDYGPLRLCMVKVADDIDLRSEIRIRAVQPLLHMMRVQISGLKDPMDLASADLRDNTASNRSLNQFVQGRG